jgi:hypothetical protein
MPPNESCDNPYIAKSVEPERRRNPQCSDDDAATPLPQSFERAIASSLNYATGQERVNLMGTFFRILEVQQVSSQRIVNALQIGGACCDKIGNQSKLLDIVGSRQQ